MTCRCRGGDPKSVFNELTGSPAVHGRRRARRDLTGPLGVDCGRTSALSAREVRCLLSLLGSDFATPLVRRQLWQNWGLCRLHLWWILAVDYEVRGEPFRAALLCEELLARAVATLRLPFVRPSRRVLGLRSTADCYVCENTTADLSAEPQDWEQRRLTRIQSLATTARALAEFEDVWTLLGCPVCVDGAGLHCRIHLLEGPGTPPRRRGEVRALASEIDSLRARLSGFVGSMRWGGPETTPETRVAWVEAVGWLAGWPAPWSR